MSQQQFLQSVRQAFDDAAAGYDRTALRFFDDNAKHLAETLPLKGHEQVLDAGTGTGKVALAVAKRLAQGRVTGIDLSNGMLSQARAKAAQANLKNVSFIQTDVNEARFPEKSFDGLTCSFGVHFWSNMEASLSHLLRFIRPSGFVAITSFAKGAFEPHSDMCLKRFERFGVKLPDSYTRDRLDSEAKNILLLESVGLTQITCHRFQAGYYLEHAHDWWDLVLYSGFRAFLNQLSPEKAARFREEFLQDVDASRDEKGIFLNVDVIIATAKLG